MYSRARFYKSALRYVNNRDNIRALRRAAVKHAKGAFMDIRCIVLALSYALL